MSKEIQSWLEGYVGALSLTFDDGRPNQVEKAVPILNDLGFKGTFYVCPSGDNWADKLSPWIDVYKQGHEIGNHTVSHICSRALSPNRIDKCLENMTLSDIEEDIIKASQRIRLLLPDQESFTFCYPCYNNHVGYGSTRQSYVPIVAKHFPAARGIGEFPFGNYPATCDLHYLWSWPVEGRSGIELVGLAERTATYNQWGIMTIHGIDDGGNLSLSMSAFRELCDFLNRNRNRIWVAPVIDVAQKIINWRKKVGISD
ncbi:MAG: polysaccharide deacetylase family protein [Candidatus Poribacteria bacterium]